MKLEKARPEDIDYIMELENHPDNRDFIWQGSYQEHLKELTEENTYLLIHKNLEGQALGYSLSKFNPRNKSFEVRRIVMEIKGLGYGRKSMQALMEFAFKELQAQRLWLDVYPHNEVGIALYKSLGFIQEGHLRRSDYQRGRYYDQLIFSILKEDVLTE